ncbi:MAG: PspC domain-containing protein [Acidobacteria bacterium]|nr:PspC domain-containing protein [Acidobacteriota bacterium]
MRSRADRRIAGVCGGVAEYFDLDPTVVRLVWVLAVILPVPLVPACLLYLAGWIFLPQAPEPAGRPVRAATPAPAP